MQEKELSRLWPYEVAKWPFVASKGIGSGYKYPYCKIAITEYVFTARNAI